MPITKLTSQQFRRNPITAKKAAKTGPVFITERGRTLYVLITFGEYERLAGHQRNIADLLTMPEAAAIEFEPPRLKISLEKPL